MGVDDNVGLELLSKTLADKHMALETSALLHQQAVLHILLIPYLPLHLLLILIILLLLIIPILFLIIIYFSSLYSSFSYSFSKFGKPPGSPSLPAGTCRTGTGMSTYRSGLLLLPGSKIILVQNYSQVTRYSQILQVSQDTNVQIV